LNNQSFWCFVFVSLFNLQGAHRSRLAAGIILPHRFRFVKHFFRIFLNLFCALIRCSAVAAALAGRLA
ncbi:hypothetical protein AALA83_02065, partial [Oscillospiraceae bacterium 44-5]